jgi:predicted HD phosphohydrolase
MKTVGFTRMQDGTAEDYQLLAEQSIEHATGLVDRVLGLLHGLRGNPRGYQVDRYVHSLQTATRALRDDADEETIVCALLHDIGDDLAPFNHAAFAAEILKPYVSPENHWLVDKHGIFQGYYFWHHIGMDRDTRDQYADHEFYEYTEEFCAKYDQTAFDPAYTSPELSYYEPLIRKFFVPAT